MATGQVGPSKFPTEWHVAKPVPVAYMDQLQALPADLSHGYINQLLYFRNLYERIRLLDGDVVECGLGEGNTFAMLAYFIGTENRQPSRILWGFDSFEGWPEPDPSDASPRHPQKGEWRVSEEMVTKRFEESGLYTAFSNLDIRITKGFVGETLPKFPRDRGIAFLHLDLDLYVGYRDALENLWPLVVPGGIVAFDEYREFLPYDPNYIVDGHPVEKWPGCTKAVDDFFRGRRERPQYYPPTQKYYVVKQ